MKKRIVEAAGGILRFYIMKHHQSYIHTMSKNIARVVYVQPHVLVGIIGQSNATS